MGRERSTKMCMASAVPTKGGGGVFMLDRVVEFIEEVGTRTGILS